MAKKTKTIQHKPVVVLDVETRLSSQEVGGWSNKSRMGISVAVLYDEATDQYLTYTQDQVGQLTAKLAESNGVVGFNLQNFDYEVIWGALQTQTRLPIPAAPLRSTMPKEWPKHITTFDLLSYIVRNKGHRLSLDAVAAGTLSEQKSGDGLDAVRMWNDKRLEELTAYCQRDVELTYRIWRFGIEHGTFWYIGRNRKAGYGYALWKEDYEHLCKR